MKNSFSSRGLSKAKSNPQLVKRHFSVSGKLFMSFQCSFEFSSETFAKNRRNDDKTFLIMTNQNKTCKNQPKPWIWKRDDNKIIGNAFK